MLGTTIAAAAAATSLLHLAPLAPDLSLVRQLSSPRDSVTVSNPRAATAVRAHPAAPRLDGRLDDPAWAQAPVLTDFTQRDPNEGQPASERTEVRVVFSDDALYLGVRAFDSQADRIAAPLARRDEDPPSDWIYVAIDSYHDRRTAFIFGVNPAGVKRDIYVYNDTNEDESWDAVWDVAVSRDGQGWTAEFRIPFSQLRFTRDASVFGFNVARRINRNNEFNMWRLIPKGSPGNVSLYGDLEGIAGIRPPRRLEVLPYTVARGARGAAEAGNPFRTGAEQSATMGADLKYGVTSNMTLDLTINPDFGQVEADPSVVNLTAFETFYPERRPFFTEGVNIFRFPLSLGDGNGANEQLFYSRRIGRRPQGFADPRGGYAAGIENTTILGAAKLSGRLASGWTVGLLSAVTAEERAEVRDSIGATHFDVVEPATRYFVGRLSRDWREGRTVLGIFGTVMNRHLPERLDYLRGQAYTAGLDWNHRFLGDRYRFRGWVVGSQVRGSTEAITRTQRSSARLFQRPDNDYEEVDTTATSLSGFAAQATIGKENGNWRFSTGFDTRSPGFEVNDMGYMRQADYFQQFVWVGRRWLQPGRVFRRVNINFNQWAGWNYGGDRLFTGGNVNSNWQFLSYWGAFAGVNRNFGGLSPTQLRGGPGLLTPGKWNGWGGIYSDSRKPLRFETGGWYFNQDENDSWGGGVWTWLAWRPSGRIDLSISPSVDWNRDDWQYLTTAEALGTTQYVFGDLEQTTLAMGLRANVTFTPNLTLQLFAEPYYSAGRYVGFSRVSNPRGAHYTDRFERFADAQVLRDTDGNVAIDLDGDAAGDMDLGNRDFSQVFLRSNVVVRWEYRPGSTLFLVWQQSRSGFSSQGNYRFGDATRGLLDARPENVFLVKVNYWLSL
jgi:hypothetical protein